MAFTWVDIILKTLVVSLGNIVSHKDLKILMLCGLHILFESYCNGQADVHSRLFGGMGVPFLWGGDTKYKPSE